MNRRQNDDSDDIFWERDNSKADAADDDIFDRGDSSDEEQDEAATQAANPKNSKNDTIKKEPHVLTLCNDIPKTSGPKDNSNACTRVVLMSDTHGRHRQVPLPAGDVLIHAGDLTLRGEPGTMQDLADYFVQLLETQKFQQVILIAGNHDVTLQSSFYQQHISRFGKNHASGECEKAAKALKASCTYLEDQTCTLWPSNSGICVYGSPWSPEYGTWAFTKPLDQMEPLWQAIPTETDILITHGPPFQRGDCAFKGGAVGCPTLLQHVQNRIQPRLHVFGHIHEDAGWVGYDGQTMFCNASNVDLRYRVVQPCVVMDVPHDVALPVRWVQPVSPVKDFASFVTWLTQHNNKEKDKYAALTAHLNSLYDKMEDLIDWQQPWTALSSLNDVFCMLAMHRDDELQNELRQAFGDLYVDSFSL